MSSMTGCSTYSVPLDAAVHGAGGLTGTADTSPSRAQLASIIMRVRIIASYQSCSSPRPRAGTTVAAAPGNHGLASGAGFTRSTGTIRLRSFRFRGRTRRGCPSQQKDEALR